MANFNLRILPPDDSSPKPTDMPLKHARRWISPFEGENSDPSLAVFVTQEAYQRVVEHAASELDNEVGGVLVGERYTETSSGRPFIVVKTTLPARFTRQGSVYLTFTQDSLVDLHAELDAHFPGKQILGWYHTHPRMGVFLSHYDTWLHTNFFPEPWQVALVIEPHAELGGFFVRPSDSVMDPSRYIGFYELDGDAGQSVVRWNNLHCNSDISKPEGDDGNE